MKKMNRNKKRILRPCIGIVLGAVMTFFVSCEKNEESLTEQDGTENTITGDYVRLDATLINADNGTPQDFGTLKAYIGDELQVLDDGLFKSASIEGHWIQEGKTLFLYPTAGSVMNLEIEAMDGQSLELSHNYYSYDNYSDGTITYTFVKKGSVNSLNHDFLSAMDLWLEKL